MQRHVLVTGGAGFIGSHLVDALLADAATRVTVLDRLSIGGSRENLAHHEGDDRFRFVLGDARDGATVDPLVASVDVVVHAAAETHVDRSIDGPLAFFESNVLGTATVLEACRHHATRLVCDAAGVWRIEALPSANGVWVQVGLVQLTGDCRFQVGEQQFLFEV